MGLAYDSSSVLGVQLDCMPAFGYVNAYHVTLSYGGPEEGGWWYSIYEPLSSIHFRNGPNKAKKAFRLLEELYKSEYEDTPGRSSMASDAGDLVITIEDTFAEPSPKERPHYS